MVPAGGMLAIKKGRMLLLLACALICQACDPPGPRALLKGERLIHNGKYSAAIDSLNEATTMLPNNSQAWNHLGLAYHYNRQYNQAVQSYRRALDLDYNLSPARFNLGSLYLEIDQPQLAANEFAAYTESKPGEAGGWVRRGLSEWRSRDWDAAYQSFQAALRLDAAQPIVWNSVGVIELYRSNKVAAHNAFKQALQYKSDYAPAIYNIALMSHFYLPREPVDPRPFALEKYREYLSLSPTPLFTDAITRFAEQLESGLDPQPRQPVALVDPPQPTFVPPAATNPVTNRTPEPPVRIVRTTPPSAEPKPVVAPKPPAPIVKSNPPPTVVRRPEPTPAPRTNTPPVRVAEVKPIPPPLPDNVIEPIVPVKPAGKPQPVVAEVKPVVSVPRPVSPAPAPTATNNAAGANRLPMGNIGDPNAELETAVARSLANLTPSATVPEPPAEIWSGETKVATIAPDYRGLRYSYLKPRAPSAGFRHKARPYFDEGRRLQRLNRMEDAVNNYRRAIDWDGGYFEAYHNLGLAATRKQDFLLAATAYETALALRPNSTSTRYNFALLLSSKSFYLDAAVELELLLQQEDDDTRAHLLLATTYDKHLRQADKARKHYARVLELAPSHPQSTAIRYWLRSN